MMQSARGRIFPRTGKIVGAWLPPALLATVVRAATLADAGACAACHVGETEALLVTGGHAVTLDCRSCHADRRPGHVGSGHRAIPRCTTCHDGAGHPAAARTGSRRSELRNCTRCHDVHGSTNMALVPTRLRAAGRLVPMRFEVRAGAAPGGFTDPSAPGTGLCEACHRTTDYYRRTGAGDEHFTETCTDCHVHPARFGVVTSDANCALCHAEQATRFTKPSGHAALLACSDCHADAGIPPGTGHRAERSCADCHDSGTHAPGGAAQPCTQCHEPHGTDNTHLVREELRTTQGDLVPIRFDDLSGRADGSFAGASDAGSGICEVCHTTTAYYRADGGGASHFTVSCLPCHRHAGGFAP